MKNGFAKTLMRPAMAATMAAAIALSPVSAAPARADGNAAGAIVATGFLALLLTGVIASARAHDDDRVEPRGPSWPNTPPHGPSWPRDGFHQPLDPRLNPRGPHIDTRRALPAVCGFVVTRDGERTGLYDRDCLVKQFRYWTLLPDRCEEPGGRSVRHRDTAYLGSCLARYGYYNENRQYRAER